MLLYRRNRTNGTWVIKAANGHGAYWTKGFAVADDFEDADGTHVLTFHQAGETGKALARGKTDTTDRCTVLTLRRPPWSIGIRRRQPRCDA
jgi:hypothetical protein